jgi:hypothetical protein
VDTAQDTHSVGQFWGGGGCQGPTAQYWHSETEGDGVV